MHDNLDNLLYSLNLLSDEFVSEYDANSSPFGDYEKIANNEDNIISEAYDNWGLRGNP